MGCLFLLILSVPLKDASWAPRICHGEQRSPRGCSLTCLFLFLPHLHRNSIAASAVCVFNLSAISQAFNGPFKYQENSRSAWLPYPNPNPNFQVIPGTKGLSLGHSPHPAPDNRQKPCADRQAGTTETLELTQCSCELPTPSPLQTVPHSACLM